MPRIEAVLRGFKAAFELRAVSAGEASYHVTAPYLMRTDQASKALMALVPDDQGAFVWSENPTAQPQ